METLDRQTLAVHKDVAEAVDQLLRGWKIHPEIRRRDDVTGQFSVLKTAEAIPPQRMGSCLLPLTGAIDRKLT